MIYIPQLSMGREEDEEVSLQEEESVPNTAHAVLREGSLECLALGRRGLFAAGKVSGNIHAPLHGLSHSLAISRMV